MGVDRIRAALVELVAVHDLRDSIEALFDCHPFNDPSYAALKAEYERRKPLAWAEAHAALQEDHLVAANKVVQHPGPITLIEPMLRPDPPVGWSSQCERCANLVVLRNGTVWNCHAAGESTAAWSARESSGRCGNEAKLFRGRPLCELCVPAGRCMKRMALCAFTPRHHVATIREIRTVDAPADSEGGSHD